DTYFVTQNTVLVAVAPGVLRNDTDVDGPHLTAKLVTTTGHGTVTLDDSGSFVYTPAADFSGLDTFTYKASDGTADSNTATVGIYVVPTNRPPEARDDSYIVTQNNTLTIGPPGVLANDS